MPKIKIQMTADELVKFRTSPPKTCTPEEAEAKQAVYDCMLDKEAMNPLTEMRRSVSRFISPDKD